jgi:hypothetical protein
MSESIIYCKHSDHCKPGPAWGVQEIIRINDEQVLGLCELCYKQLFASVIKIEMADALFKFASHSSIHLAQSERKGKYG